MPCPNPATIVFRLCKAIERGTDRFTGAAGPVLVAFAVILLSVGTFCFFEVIEPTLPLRLVLTPACVLIVVNMFAHYYYACTVSPGFTPSPLGPRARGTPQGDTMSPAVGFPWAPRKHDVGFAPVLPEMTPARVTVCRRCGGRKPERAHHCRICNRCVMKYDHHCPWINQCVGIYNERHFVLFMGYLTLATWSFAISGYSFVWAAAGYSREWPYNSPAIAFMLSYVLSLAIGLAISIMFIWTLWGIAVGETSVESQDFEHYRKVARERGEIFVNAYHLGRRRNLELFFNAGPQGAYAWWTLLLPLRALPYTDGHSWARLRGENVGVGFRPGDEVLTDDEPDD